MFFSLILLSLALVGCAGPQGPATKLEKANVLPLSINDNFQFRKVKLYYNDTETVPPPRTQSEMIQFERQRINYGALNSYDRQQRYGNYFNFFWKTSERADVTVRLEYRQAALGNYVMARELYYPEARGSYQSDFAVIGDDYLENGRVTSWRAVLIVEGRIVAVTQSYMWR